MAGRGGSRRGGGKPGSKAARKQALPPAVKLQAQKVQQGAVRRSGSGRIKPA